MTAVLSKSFKLSRAMNSYFYTIGSFGKFLCIVCAFKYTCA